MPRGIVYQDNLTQGKRVGRTRTLFLLQAQSGQQFIRLSCNISFSTKDDFGLHAKTHKYPEGLSYKMYYQSELHLVEEMSEKSS